ncbi:hypothetical protein N4X08_004161 [Salmonella enterica]|nr:hypothetical protein [Salmonella enterica]
MAGKKVKDLAQLIETMEKNGTKFKKWIPCPKCGERLYYIRKDGNIAVCVNCANNRGSISKQYTETPISKPDGILVYIGKKCRNCRSTERLLVNSLGKKAGACYCCALEDESRKGATHQHRRLRQEINRETRVFIIKDIFRGGTIEVAPKTWYEYELVMYLIERKKRLNAIEEINKTGIRWEIGHYCPNSGCGTGYRGKTVAENLYLVKAHENRLRGESFPDDWKSCQVVWVGDLISTMTQREAAAEWRKLMKIDSVSTEERKQREKLQKEENQRHYEGLKKLSAEDIAAIDSSLESESTFQATYQKLEANLKRSELKSISIIRNAEKRGDFISKTKGNCLEEDLHGLNARRRCVYNTMSLFLEMMKVKDEKLKTVRERAEHEVQCSIIQNALLHWAKRVLGKPNIEIEGFSHPLLTNALNPKLWGIQQGEDGKYWLCGWKWKVGKEPEPIDIRESYNAHHLSNNAEIFYRKEREKLGGILKSVEEVIEIGRWWLDECMKLSVTEEITIDNDYDAESVAIQKELLRKDMIENVEQRERTYETLKSEFYSFWNGNRRKTMSSSEVESHVNSVFMPRLERYRTKPEAGYKNIYSLPKRLKEYYAPPETELHNTEESPY